MAINMRSFRPKRKEIVSHGLLERADVQDAICRQRLDLRLWHCYYIDGFSHCVKYFQCVTRLLRPNASMVFDDRSHVPASETVPPEAGF
jgi:hypothetical protein